MKPRIEPQRTWTEAVIILLVRRWVATRAERFAATQALVSLGAELGAPLMLPIALDSLLQLTEACLRRELKAECCCSSNFSADERAVLLLIEAGSNAGAQTDPSYSVGITRGAWNGATSVRMPLREWTGGVV